MVSAREGVARALAAVAEGARMAACLRRGAFDPSVMPSAIARAPGGLGHGDVPDPVVGAAARAEVVGLGVVETMPSRDVDGLGASAAAMLAASLLGVVALG